MQRRGLPLEDHNREVLEYYDRLLQDSTTNTIGGVGITEIEHREGSNVVRVIKSSSTDGEQEQEEEQSIIRLCHLASLLPNTNKDGSLAKDWGIYTEAAGYLAMLHFNQRDSSIIPEVKRLENCNVQFTESFYDTEWSPLEAVRVLTKDVMNNDDSETNATTTTPQPVAVLGATRSATTGPLSMIAGINYQLPVISAGSASSTLNDRSSYPYFARTVPTSQGDAVAAARYFRDVLNVYHMGIFHATDTLGLSFHEELQIALKALDPPMVVVSAPYPVIWSEEAVRIALQSLKQSGYRFFYGIISGPVLENFLRQAAQLKIAGEPGYTWIFSAGSSNQIAGSHKNYDATEQADMIAAVNGAGVITYHFDHSPAFDRAWAMLEQNKDLKDYFVERHARRHGGGINGSLINFDDLEPTFWMYFAYDAVMALGFAACDDPNEFFTGPQLFESLMDTTFFRGASGIVDFDPSTGNRRTEQIAYKITNVLARPPDENNRVYFDTNVIYQQMPERNHTWHKVSGATTDYVYSSGTSDLPPDLPPLGVSENKIGPGLLGFGWSLAGFCILASVGFLGWTFLHRRSVLVASSQPFFLVMICCGAFLMGCSIVPMGFQEPVGQNWLDAGCMLTPWLFSCGFVVSFSGLFSKTARVYMLMRSSQTFHRVVIKVQDVLVPFFILGSVNVTVLTCWTIIDPLRWVRAPHDSLDPFGRPTATYGTCQSTDAKLEKAFYVVLFLVMMVALLAANIANYKARHVSHRLHESGSINLAMAIMLEACLIGAPAMLVLQDDPSSYFVVRSFLVGIFCSAVLGPMFIPKVLRFKKLNADAATALVSLTQQIGRTSSRKRDSQGTVAEIRERAASSGGLSSTSSVGILDSSNFCDSSHTIKITRRH